MEEIWTDIKGYEGLYQVSNLGRVKGLNRTIETKKGIRKYKGKILAPVKCTNGYLEYYLFKEGKRKFYLAHRLVAQAFIPNPDNKPEVNHKDEVVDNNIVTNLEWITHIDNMNYGTRNERASKKVVCITTNKTFISIKEASKYYDISNSAIVMCCKGQRDYGGKLPDGTKLVWQYVA